MSDDRRTGAPPSASPKGGKQFSHDFLEGLFDEEEVGEEKSTHYSQARAADFWSDAFGSFSSVPRVFGPTPPTDYYKSQDHRPGAPFSSLDDDDSEASSNRILSPPEEDPFSPGHFDRREPIIGPLGDSDDELERAARADWNDDLMEDGPSAPPPDSPSNHTNLADTKTPVDGLRTADGGSARPADEENMWSPRGKMLCGGTELPVEVVHVWGGL